MTYVNVET